MQNDFFFQPTLDSLRLYRATLLLQIQNIPDWGKLGGLLAGAASLVLGDILTPVLCLIAIANVLDWFFGRAAAVKERVYQKDLSTYGWQVKAGALCIIMLVRGFEFWLLGHEIIDTRGFVATAIGVGLLADEVDSIDVNLRRLGHRGIPGLTRALAFMRAIQSKMGDQDTPQRRSTDA